VVNEVYYTVEDIDNRISFHETKRVELTLTGDDPALLAHHKYQIERFTQLRIKALVLGKVDITKYT
jgi:hypothetical protein